MVRDAALLGLLAFGICLVVGGLLGLIDELMRHARGGRHW